MLELESDGDAAHRLLWGPAVDQALADEISSGDVYWYLNDHLGTVRDVVQYDSGTGTTDVANHIAFDSFGRRTSETFSALGDFNLGFTGKWLDRATGLQWNQNRWYNPGIQRWMSEDVIWDGTNKYAYVGNRATSYLDPDGLEAKGYWEGVGDVFEGYGDAAVGTAKGLWWIVTHPRDARDGLAKSVIHPIQTSKAIWGDVCEKSGTVRGQGELVGDVLIGVASGGATKAARAPPIS